MILRTSRSLLISCVLHILLFFGLLFYWNEESDDALNFRVISYLSIQLDAPLDVDNTTLVAKEEDSESEVGEELILQDVAEDTSTIERVETPASTEPVAPVVATETPVAEKNASSTDEATPNGAEVVLGVGQERVVSDLKDSKPGTELENEDISNEVEIDFANAEVMEFTAQVEESWEEIAKEIKPLHPKDLTFAEMNFYNLASVDRTTNQVQPEDSVLGIRAVLDQVGQRELVSQPEIIFDEKTSNIILTQKIVAILTLLSTGEVVDVRLEEPGSGSVEFDIYLKEKLKMIVFNSATHGHSLEEVQVEIFFQ